MKMINAWVSYITIFLLCGLLFLVSGCENTRHSIGVTGKPLSTKFDESIKYINKSLAKDPDNLGTLRGIIIF